MGSKRNTSSAASSLASGLAHPAGTREREREREKQKPKAHAHTRRVLTHVTCCMFNPHWLPSLRGPALYGTRKALAMALHRLRCMCQL